MSDFMTDVFRLNWLGEQKNVNIRAIREDGAKDPTDEAHAYRAGHRLQLFTVASQHVYGRDIRDAIDNAIGRAKQRRDRP